MASKSFNADVVAGASPALYCHKLFF